VGKQAKLRKYRRENVSRVINVGDRSLMSLRGDDAQVFFDQWAQSSPSSVVELDTDSESSST